MKDSEVLRQASIKLSQRGWCQNLLQDYKTGSVCLVGALSIANNRGSDIPYTDVQARYLEKAIGTIHFSIWNDTPGRTQKEVQEALLKAADLAQADGF